MHNTLNCTEKDKLKSVERINLTWRRYRTLRESGVRPPKRVVETKAYPFVGLKGESLLSNLKVYFKEDSNPWPSCLLVDLDAICDGSVKVRQPRVYTKSWCFVDIKSRDIPINCSLYEENSCQSWEDMNIRARRGVKNPFTWGAYTPKLTSVAWFPP
jgi:hypothetical protein